MFAIQFTKKALYAMALALLLCSANAASIPGGLSKRGDKVVKLDFNVQRPDKKIVVTNDTSIDQLNVEAVSAQTIEQPLINRDVSYFTKLWLGSNAQEVDVVVDTGSSDLWVIDSASGLDADYGTYDHSSSSSYQYVASGFDIAYVDQSNAQGNWVKDKVSLSSTGPSIPDLEFGDATQAEDITYGILGIGFKLLEAASSKYSNLPYALKDYGIIDKVAYSLYLGDKGSQSGTVLFGGIDNDKYSGSLVELPIQSSNRLDVTLKSIGGLSVNADYTLDSGSTISTLPPTLLYRLAQQLGTDGYTSGIYYWNNCDDVKDVTLDFDGISITIPKKDMTIELTYTNGDKFPGCGMAFQSNSQYFILGDNFLRQVYAVYDLEDKKISLAPVKCTSSENITPI